MIRPLTLAFLALSLGSAPVRGQDGGRTTLDRIFSTTQSERGRAVYSRVCGECHTRSQFSATDGFQRNWQGRSFFDVFEQLKSTMPQDNPGGLSRSDYVDVIAWMLHEFGYPSGETDLPATDSGMKSIRIVAPPDHGAKVDAGRATLTRRADGAAHDGRPGASRRIPGQRTRAR